MIITSPGTAMHGLFWIYHQDKPHFKFPGKASQTSYLNAFLSLHLAINASKLYQYLQSHPASSPHFCAQLW